jgi:hypothetical protein
MPEYKTLAVDRVRVQNAIELNTPRFSEVSRAQPDLISAEISATIAG